jgi:UPF0755 protein
MAKQKKVSPFSWKLLSILLAIPALSFTALFTYYDMSPRLLFTLSFYENLANPSVRIVRVEEGMRKEEIAEVVAQKLGWDESEKNEFINVHLALKSDDLEGHYFPKTYMLLKDEGPNEVSSVMFNEFSKQTASIKMTRTNQVINPDTALKIASIIQREASGKKDMKLISGIIWNRIFSGMKLQMDATLQYAKGSEESGWWREVTTDDKKIDSPYNTYLYKNLPPLPIANPGLAALDAAYNPQKTNCIYYLHDKKGRIHCSVTYEEHRKNIDKYL